MRQLLLSSLRVEDLYRLCRVNIIWVIFVRVSFCSFALSFSSCVFCVVCARHHLCSNIILMSFWWHILRINDNSPAAFLKLTCMVDPALSLSRIRLLHNTYDTAYVAVCIVGACGYIVPWPLSHWICVDFKDNLENRMRKHNLRKDTMNAYLWWSASKSCGLLTK